MDGARFRNSGRVAGEIFPAISGIVCPGIAEIQAFEAGDAHNGAAGNTERFHRTFLSVQILLFLIVVADREE